MVNELDRVYLINFVENLISSNLFSFDYFRTKKLIDESGKHLKDIEDTLKVSESFCNREIKMVASQLSEKIDVHRFIYS